MFQKIKRVKKPQRPIKLCLTINESNPCKWLVFNKRYVCHSGTWMCPLVRSARYCRAYGYRLANEDLKEDIKRLNKRITYLKWTGKAFENKAAQLKAKFTSIYEKTLEDERELRLERVRIWKLLRLNALKTKRAVTRRVEAEGKLNLSFFHSRRKGEFDKEKGSAQSRIDRKKRKIKRLFGGLEELKGGLRPAEQEHHEKGKEVTLS